MPGFHDRFLMAAQQNFIYVHCNLLPIKCKIFKIQVNYLCSVVNCLPSSKHLNQSVEVSQPKLSKQVKNLECKKLFYYFIWQVLSTSCSSSYSLPSHIHIQCSQLRLESTTWVLWKKLHFNSWQQHAKCLIAIKANSQTSESRKTSNTNQSEFSQEQRQHCTFTLIPKPSSFIDYSDTSLDLISTPFALWREASKYISISLMKHLMANTRIIPLIITFKREFSCS